MTEPWTIYGPAVRGRSCGACKLCCVIVPVELPSGHKAAGERCAQLCSRGCSIYAARPDPCRFWSCRWLFDDRTGELRRPDRTGYVIDAMLDEVLSDGRRISCAQVWCDPARPDAHRDPALRRYLEAIGLPAIVRWSQETGMLLVPPVMSAERDWIELRSNLVSREDMAARLQGAA